MSKNENGKNIVLAIETSVPGGSISLLEKGREVDFWQGSGSISKSEDILDEISKLLKKNGVKKRHIEQIVVSRGPGSFTGTRIGLAIGLGLKKSLGCDICGVSVLEAMAFQSEGKNSIITALPIGIKQVCFQRFRVGQKNELREITMPYLVSFEAFMKDLGAETKASFVLYGKLYKIVLENIQRQEQILKRMVNSGENLAYFLGLQAIEQHASDNVQPIYIQETR